ncbi:transforming growth factor-beta-induced protein ig-h3-like [Daphnia pulicaria]|uniref:transforming growth factor-beta-induced protein ig-h3-like n=1 Tax=Daphnia pulicaria TaxID=35523 RepID=UPI001EEC8138|nr:transforming growth factor-beta-induced protein ig-h3-like [Daphnia pulicaria]
MNGFLLATFLLLAVGSTLGSNSNQYSSSYTGCRDTIPSVLKKNGLTKLAALVTEAGLADTLSGPGPFTLFAPTDEAFASIDPKTLKIILEDVNLLKDILTYHVVAFEIPPSFLSATQQVYQLPTVQGSAPVRINVYRENGAITFDPVKTVTVNGALVLRKLKACNGYVYVIDKVLNPKDLMPENDEMEIFDRYGLTTIKKIFDVLGAIPSVNIFYRPETIFAPTDAAFAALPPGLLDSLLADKKKLYKFINNQIVSGYHYSRGLETGPILAAFGVVVDVQVSPGKITYGGANVVIPDITNVQGVIHVVDAVLLTDEDFPADQKYSY